MAKRFKSPERFLKPDARYGSLLISKLINQVMRRGKRSTSEKLVYAAMEILKERVKDKDPLEVVKTAVDNVKPRVEVRSRRVGGATLQVPVEVPQRRQLSLAFRWLLEAARSKKGKPMAKKLADELYQAYMGEGDAVTKRDNTHKMAEANRAFAHYAW